MNEPIDWTKPICLDTVPPRMAHWNGGRGVSEPECYDVEADWDGKGRVVPQFVKPCGDKLVRFNNQPVRVRNVRPGDFPATPATDIAAELAEFARRFADMSDVEADFIEPGMCGYADGFAIRTEARAALAKWEASQ